MYELPMGNRKLFAENFNELSIQNMFSRYSTICVEDSYGMNINKSCEGFCCALTAVPVWPSEVSMVVFRKMMLLSIFICIHIASEDDAI